MLPSSTDLSSSFADWVGFIFLSPDNQNWQLQLYLVAHIQPMTPLAMAAGYFFPSPLVSTAVPLDSFLQWSLKMSHLPAMLEEIPVATAEAPQKPADPIFH